MRAKFLKICKNHIWCLEVNFRQLGWQSWKLFWSIFHPNPTGTFFSFHFIQDLKNLTNLQLCKCSICSLFYAHTSINFVKFGRESSLMLTFILKYDFKEKLYLIVILNFYQHKLCYLCENKNITRILREFVYLIKGFFSTRKKCIPF